MAIGHCSDCDLFPHTVDPDVGQRREADIQDFACAGISQGLRRADDEFHPLGYPFAGAAIDVYITVFHHNYVSTPGYFGQLFDHPLHALLHCVLDGFSHIVAFESTCASAPTATGVADETARLVRLADHAFGS